MNTIFEFTKNQFDTLTKIKEGYLPKTLVPKENNWKTLTENEIWLNVVAQVIVVGGSKPYEKLDNDEELQKQIAFENLLKIKNPSEIKVMINKILRNIGTRYVSSDLSKCRKSQALTDNFVYLTHFKGGSVGFLEYISKINDENQRINFVKKNLGYIQNKGARDFLMELGLVRNSIALDSRVTTILGKLGIKIQKELLSDSTSYKKIQTELLEKICKPLNISGIEFDRLLYQNYTEILEFLNK